MIVATGKARKIPEYRYCPHCKGGIGECQNTRVLNEGMKRKRRHYQCLACDKWWTVTIRVMTIIEQVRYVSTEGE
jgi:hypothetical protein